MQGAYLQELVHSNKYDTTVRVFYLKCLQGLENTEITLKCYVVTEFNQLVSTTDLGVHVAVKKCSQ